MDKTQKQILAELRNLLDTIESDDSHLIELGQCTIQSSGGSKTATISWYSHFDRE